MPSSYSSLESPDGSQSGTPRQYLVHNKATNLIEVADIKPASHTDERKSQDVIGGVVAVFCEPGVHADEFSAAIKMFNTRCEHKELIENVNSAISQLEEWEPRLDEIESNERPAVLALGASPKLVKWALKDRGFKVATINASSIPREGAPTPDFNNYVDRKLQKLGDPKSVIVMDFADSGASLLRIRDDVRTLRDDPRVTVRTVALGTSPAFKSSKNEANRELIDKVVGDIGTLETSLNEQRLKNHSLGRNKAKNYYATWNKADASKLETGSMKGMPAHEFYQQQKLLLKAAMQLPVLNVEVDNLLPQQDEPGVLIWRE
ncbi:hypothetical protein [Rugamonas sp. DEMB1]|uniref:hypothetical protein n=1 Tax=Rugamonas sp. DEMB1 TaxID=3039386 RepID=UPI00244B1ECA|nr:hypothetical protein [Rugamonas sp. DEMB1]WGG49421.1 hypothetical protein QC826_23030 [Rugamonas sp. DEMB1]